MAQMTYPATGADELAVFVADAREPGSPIVHVDQGFEAATGFSLAMLRGRSWTTLCLDADSAARSVQDDGAAVPVALLTAGARSRQLVTPFLVKAVRDGQGVVTAVIGVSTTPAERRLVPTTHWNGIGQAA